MPSIFGSNRCDLQRYEEFVHRAEECLMDGNGFVSDGQFALLCLLQRYPPTQQLHAPSLIFILAKDDCVQWL